MDDHAPGTWVGLLDAPPGPNATLVTSGPGIDHYVEVLPAGVIRWVAVTARQTAAHCMDVVPIFTAGSPQASALHSEIEAAILGLLNNIEAGCVAESSLTWFQDRTVRAFIQWRIPLTDVLASVMRSHAYLASRLMRECIALTDAGSVAEHLTALNEITAEFINRLAELIVLVYSTENERMIASAMAARQEAVEAVLRGDDDDVDEASRTLRYDIANRHHIGIVVWHDLPVGEEVSTLQLAAKEWLTAAGAEQTLCLPQGRAMVWAWGNRRTAFADERLQTASTSTPATRVAVGIPGSGAQGFRQSHIDSGQVYRISTTFPGHVDPVTTFDSVALWTILSPDHAAVKRFALRELGDLAAHDPYVADLRNTLRAFLESHSPQAAGAKLFLARNTVKYRLRRAEELLGRPLTERQLELWLALTVIERLHTAYEANDIAALTP